MENTQQNNIITENNGEISKPFSDIFKQDKEHNTRMLISVPGLKDTIVPHIYNQYFFPKQYTLTEEETEKFKTMAPIDEQGYIHTNIEVDGKPVVFHQHFSALKEKDKSYQTQDALGFDIDGLKIIFENKIPLCFKQTVAILAYQQHDPSLLTIAFEKEELQAVTLALNESLKLEYKE